MEAKKSIESVVLGTALVVSLGGLMVVPMDANATVACSLSTTGAGTSVAGNAASFIKVGFNPKCSPNTYVDWVQTTQAVFAKGANIKGSIVYGATSEGGGGAVSCASGSAAVVPAATQTGPCT